MTGREPVGYSDYLDNVLTPQLTRMGLNAEEVAHATADIGRRMSSLLAHWPDEGFRCTILFQGEEEAAFYEPANAADEVRRFVVVTVRNSALEGYHWYSARARKAQQITDGQMKEITSAAVSFFAQVGLDEVAASVPGPEGKDLFGPIPERYPVAWAVIGKLAHPTVRTLTFEPVAVLRRPRLEQARSSVRGNVYSGMEGNLTAGDLSVMRQIERGRIETIAAPCLKMITRHPVKFFRIIDFALSYGAVVATWNYWIENGRVRPRDPLAKPAHFSGGHDPEQILRQWEAVE